MQNSVFSQNTLKFKYFVELGGNTVLVELYQHLIFAKHIFTEKPYKQGDNTRRCPKIHFTIKNLHKKLYLYIHNITTTKQAAINYSTQFI